MFFWNFPRWYYLDDGRGLGMCLRAKSPSNRRVVSATFFQSVHGYCRRVIEALKISQWPLNAKVSGVHRRKFPQQEWL